MAKHPYRCSGPGCHLCWVAENDARYREKWAKLETQPALSLPRLAGNYIVSTIRHVVSGFRGAGDSVKEQRLSLCLTCPELDGRKCRKCGCPVQAKVKRDSERCPIGKWGPAGEFPAVGKRLQSAGSKQGRCGSPAEPALPEEHLAFRQGTWDEDIWKSVVADNKYHLPAKLDGVVVDIGAHIGAFAWACLLRGAAAVYAYEPHPDNYHLMRHNNRMRKERLHAEQKAVWGEPTTLGYVRCPNRQNTGGGSTLPLDGGDVQAVALDGVLAEAAKTAERVQLLKLSCEGAEFAILEGTTRLDLVDEICGEYHEDAPRGQTGERIRGLLERAGFVVTLRPTAANLGLFWGKRS